MDREEYLNRIHRQIQSVNDTLDKVDRQTRHYEKYKYLYNTLSIALGIAVPFGVYCLILLANQSLCY